METAVVTINALVAIYANVLNFFTGKSNEQLSWWLLMLHKNLPQRFVLSF